MSKRPSVWTRWGPIAAALATGAALLGSITAGYLGTRRASDALVRGQGDVFLQAADELFRARGAPPTSADLAELLARFEADGLRYVGLILEDGRPVAEAGTHGPEPLPRGAGPAGPRQLLELGGRVRLVAPPQPPPPGLPPAPQATLRQTPAFPPGFPPPPPFPRLVLEFEPRWAEELIADGRIALVVGGLASAAFVVFALLLARSFRQREALERTLGHERRLALLGEMSAVLAHEIRNPLTSLKGHAQLLLEALPADGRDRGKAERVVREAVRLENLTNDLLDFVRSGEIRPEETDPAGLLRQAAEDVDDARCTLHVEEAPGRWPLDAARMRQVLANVLRNAEQASPEGAQVEASVAERDGRLVFAVRDRGSGIPAGEEERIFEPFHTGRVRGTGLGLAVARRIVEGHGGAITAENHPEGGAVFRIAIPRGGGRDGGS